MVVGMTVRRALGRSFLRAEQIALRGRIRVRAMLVGGGFDAFGAGARLHPSVRVTCPERIGLGRGVWVGAGAWLHALEGPGQAIELGDGCSLAGNCTIAAAQRVVLGRQVLVARGVYLSDHSHAFSDPDVAVLAQGVDGIAPVEVGDGAWLGENAVICPGVSIGRGAIVGANSVVTRDVAARTIVAGAPARVIRVLDAGAEPVAA
jgi:carbonic anhydrase/acetyltransferase-like protein (isoleucine patch superfamily)